jgi:hypothetical protein
MATYFQALPFHFSVSGPPLWLRAFSLRPTATQALGDTQEIPNSSSAAAGENAAVSGEMAASGDAGTAAGAEAPGPTRAVSAMNPAPAIVRMRLPSHGQSLPTRTFEPAAELHNER